MSVPDIESRFLPPKNWHTDTFINAETGHKIHYGYAFPDPQPKAGIVVLGGLSEFSEKYYETANDMLHRGYAFFFMDWAYQGRSTRFPGNTHKRHSDGYDADVSDLNLFITNHVLPAIGNTPLAILTHSMGGLICLKYLTKHQNIIRAAALSAPFLGVGALKYSPNSVMRAFLKLLTPLHECYVPGGSDFKASMRPGDGSGPFSSDPVRDALHNAWSLHDSDLQIGSPTLGWLHHSYQAIQNIKAAPKPTIPLLLGIAGKEDIVCNRAIRTFASHCPNARSIELDEAKHEILMEKDQTRNAFLDAFDRLLADHGIPLQDS